MKVFLVLLILYCQSALAEDALTEIFMNADEMEKLDQMRKNNSLKKGAEDNHYKLMRFNGFVMKNNKPIQVFINGNAYMGSINNKRRALYMNNIRVDGQGILFMSDKGRYYIKPGQTWNTQDKKVREFYQFK